MSLPDAAVPLVAAVVGGVLAIAGARSAYAAQRRSEVMDKRAGLYDQILQTMYRGLQVCVSGYEISTVKKRLDLLSEDPNAFIRERLEALGSDLVQNEALMEKVIPAILKEVLEIAGDENERLVELSEEPSDIAEAARTAYKMQGSIALLISPTVNSQCLRVNHEMDALSPGDDYRELANQIDRLAQFMKKELAYGERNLFVRAAFAVYALWYRRRNLRFLRSGGTRPTTFTPSSGVMDQQPPLSSAP